MYLLYKISLCINKKIHNSERRRKLDIECQFINITYIIDKKIHNSERKRKQYMLVTVLNFHWFSIRRHTTLKGDGNYVLVFLNNKWFYNIYLDNSIFQLKLAHVYQKFELISIFICNYWCIFFCTMIWLKFSYGKIEYTYK